MTSTFSFKTLYDHNQTRFRLVKELPGKYNWLFFPGGPGADSSYLLSLSEKLNLPGKVWLVDLKENGTNSTQDQNYNFDEWFENFVPAINFFENPIYVGHSFGGMLPLMFPELENILKGLIIIASAPKFDQEETIKIIKEKSIEIDKTYLEAFLKNPNNETFKKALLSGARRHFPISNLEKGKVFLKNINFNFYATLWINNKIELINSKISWTPSVPTLILGGTEDCINPISIFKKDTRFKKENIEIVTIEKAGHFPWVDNNAAINQINIFTNRL